MPLPYKSRLKEENETEFQVLHYETYIYLFQFWTYVEGKCKAWNWGYTTGTSSKPEPQHFNELLGICSGKIYTDLTKLVDNIKDGDNPKISSIRSQPWDSAKYTRTLIQNQFIWTDTWKNKDIHLLFPFTIHINLMPRVQFTSQIKQKSKILIGESWYERRTAFQLDGCQIQWFAGTGLSQLKWIDCYIFWNY